MAYSSGGFRPTMIEDMMADTQAGFKSRRIGAIRRQDAAEEARLGRRDESAAYADQRMAEDKAAKAEAARIAPIEGESQQDQLIRLENQASQPNLYGSKYRDALKKGIMDGPGGAAAMASPSGAPADEQKAMDEDRLRRKRLMMAGMSDTGF